MLTNSGKDKENELYKEINISFQQNQPFDTIETQIWYIENPDSEYEITYVHRLSVDVTTVYMTSRL